MGEKPKTINAVIVFSILSVAFYLVAFAFALFDAYAVSRYFGQETEIAKTFVFLDLIKTIPAVFCAIGISQAFRLRKPWAVRAFNIATVILVAATLIVACIKIVIPNPNHDFKLLLIVSGIYLAVLFGVNRVVNRPKILNYFNRNQDRMSEIVEVFE